jgi:hypothetical protein
MNRARQDSITTEIMEIVSGAEALAQDQSSDDELLLDRTTWAHITPHKLDHFHH